MFNNQEKNNIILKLSITEDELIKTIQSNGLRVYDNAKDALLKAYNLSNNDYNNKNGKQLLLNLIKINKEQCIGLDDNLTLADAFIAFHPNTCRASDDKFVVFLKD